MYKIVVG